MRAPTEAHLHDEDCWFVATEDIPSLNTALSQLMAGLRQAQSEFAGGEQLNGAYSSITTVIAFLSRFVPVREEGLFVPLAALESALWALDEGIVEPILKPPRLCGSVMAW